MKIIVTTYPFGHTNNTPIKILQENKLDFCLNEAKRKLTKEEHWAILADQQPDVIIAGTEKYDSATLDISKNLKMISRVGIGIDGIDLNYCKMKGIIVTNTPDAPSNAVAELTICQILNMLRKIQNVSNDMILKDKWNRYIGRELKDCIVGIIGFGRVGKLVWKKLRCFDPKHIYINDLESHQITSHFQIPASIKELLTESDIISLHIPLNDGKFNNTNFIRDVELNMMKPDVRLLNMSRGGIINEKDLYDWLIRRPKATVALDTFTSEPYNGILSHMGNVYSTPHLGSCTTRARYDMEVGAVNNVIDYLNNTPLKDRVV